MLRPLLGLELEQVEAVEDADRAADLVRRVADEHGPGSTCPEPVRPHDGVDLAAPTLRSTPFEDRLLRHRRPYSLHVEDRVARRHLRNAARGAPPLGLRCSVPGPPPAAPSSTSLLRRASPRDLAARDLLQWSREAAISRELIATPWLSSTAPPAAAAALLSALHARWQRRSRWRQQWPTPTPTATTSHNLRRGRRRPALGGGRPRQRGANDDDALAGVADRGRPVLQGRAEAPRDLGAASHVRRVQPHLRARHRRCVLSRCAVLDRAAAVRPEGGSRSTARRRRRPATMYLIYGLFVLTFVLVLTTVRKLLQRWRKQVELTSSSARCRRSRARSRSVAAGL